MTGQLAASQPYTTRFETTVAGVDGRAVRLDTSYFYAESGGQPSDRGTVGGVPVVDVQVEDGEHVHTLAEAPGFHEGSSVVCEVDWTFRMYCMRAHTASHVLYGAARRVCDDLGYGGFGIDEEKVRVDLTTSSDVTDETLVELERLTNMAVWESREVGWKSVPLAELRDDEFVAFNTKTEEGVFEGADEVRVVTVGEGDVVPGEPRESPWDVAACGGTHVRNTREIGPVTLLSRSNPGEGMTRIEFAVGDRGIEHRAAEKQAVLDTGRALDAPPADLADAAARLSGQVEELEESLASARRQLVASALSAADPVERDGATWLVATVEGVEANDCREPLQASAGRDADVVVAVGESGGTFVAVAAGPGHDASAVVERVTADYGGGGGGSGSFAQGGGIDASSARVARGLGSEGS
ncbi:DHHA1 domain-containing protein [Haloarchaeobius sp. FL176]|uniref:alanyl-tRNA editing protein n=1 Tax=Haloarchaeobius sp. FL176 TaxID=2967129 RepID=UPI002149418F|nr:DHHA1 domain-containing protein [Haloarchaeobius sp. FL176]